MGIKHLNHFLVENCSPRSIRKINLREFTNKPIVIDTSIYLYKFAEKNAIAENIYLMISVLRQYNIIPVFVFDGKPPAEKKAVLMRRKMEKDAAEEKYNAIRSAIDNSGGTITPYMSSVLDSLKKQFVRISDADIKHAKEVMTAYGVQYIESIGESDQLCAFLVKHGFAWACISDDMDMFLYGCPRVLRHLSLLNHEAIYYNTQAILQDLDMSQEILNDIAILSGTDYNDPLWSKHTEHRSFSDIVRLYMEYCEYVHYSPPGLIPKEFYQWLMDIKSIISSATSLFRSRDMFSLDKYLATYKDEIKRVIDVLPFQQQPFCIEILANTLRGDGFIFV